MGTRYLLDDDYLSAGGLQVKVDRTEISKRTRLASGSLVKDLIAVKRTWSFTYDELPGATANVSDGGLGRDDLKGLFDAGSTMTLTVPVESGTDEDVTVMFGEIFSEKRLRTRPFWRWKVDFELVEV